MSKEEVMFKVFDALNKHDISYLTIGGIPVVLLGVERATFDVDFAVPSDDTELERIIKIMSDLGYTKVVDPQTKIFLMNVAQLTAGVIIEHKGVEFRNENLFPVDVLPVEHGALLSMKDREIVVPKGESKIVMAAPEDIIKLKLMCGRDKDLMDVLELKKLGYFLTHKDVQSFWHQLSPAIRNWMEREYLK